MTIDRNSTVIGNIQLGTSSATGGGDSAKDKFEKTKIVTMLSFDATSDQKDETDKYMLIQKNKHQYERSESRNALWRMCEYIRKMFANKLWEKMEKNAIEFSIIKEKCKSQIIIKNAYKVYKFKSHIQDRINLKRAQLPSPSPSPIPSNHHLPIIVHPGNNVEDDAHWPQSNVLDEVHASTVAAAEYVDAGNHDVVQQCIDAQGNSHTNQVISHSPSPSPSPSEPKSPSPVPPTPITRSPPSPFSDNVENEDKDEEIRKLKEIIKQRDEEIRKLKDENTQLRSKIL